MKLYQSADPLSFLHMTSLARPTFAMLLDYLLDLEDIVRRRRRGCPWLLGPEGCLGLPLFYLGSTMNYKHLCMLFGITPSCDKYDAEKGGPGITVGTLQDGYVHNIPLPRVPREQRASPELTAPKA